MPGESKEPSTSTTAIAWRVAGALPLVTAFLWYELGLTMYYQIDLIRTLGCLAVFAVGILAGSGILAYLSKILHMRRNATVDLGVLLLFGVNLVLVGLAIFSVQGRPPWPASLASMTLGLAWAIAVVRQQPPERRQTLDRVLRLGLVLLAVPLAATPWVAAAYMKDEPRLASSPEPLQAHMALSAPPRRILLVTFDALRAQSTTLADPALDTTPTLAAMAKDSTVFTQCRSASDWTRISMPAILSGIKPADLVPHLDNPQLLIRTNAVTGLAGHLAAAGYQSYYATMLVSPQWLGVGREFKEGFTVNDDAQSNFNARAFLPVGHAIRWSVNKVAHKLRHKGGMLLSEVEGVREIADSAARYLNSPEERVFVWAHLGAPHTPYVRVPSSDWHAPLRPDTYERLWEGKEGDDPAPYEAAYLEYLRYTDAQLGRLFKAMQDAGTWDDTLVVVTSDHGEIPGLPYPHGNGSAQELEAHVPLLIHEPGQTEARRVDRIVGHLDISPTILSRVYDRQPRRMKGRPLLTASTARTVTYHYSLPSVPDPQGRWLPMAVAAYQDGFKYVVRLPEERETLFALPQDPLAQRDVKGSHPDVFATLAGRVAEESPPWRNQ